MQLETIKLLTPPPPAPKDGLGQLRDLLLMQGNVLDFHPWPELQMVVVRFSTPAEAHKACSLSGEAICGQQLIIEPALPELISTFEVGLGGIVVALPSSPVF